MYALSISFTMLLKFGQVFSLSEKYLVIAPTLPVKGNLRVKDLSLTAKDEYPNSAYIGTPIITSLEENSLTLPMNSGSAVV